MKDRLPHPAEEELARADSLLDQADAFLRRHQGDETRPVPERSEILITDDDDLPILTEVVEDFVLPAAYPQQAAAPAADAPPQPQERDAVQFAAELAGELAERLIEVDTEITRSIEEWMSSEFPQFLERELSGLGERLQQQLHAHVRATLLPQLSAHISRQIDRGAACAPEAEID